MITRETIDRVIDTVRIEEVVGDFVHLKKRGTNLIGLCPFHNEKTPSFNVNPTRNIYKCFGCGKGGDAVSFVMEHEKYSFAEAVRYLADKYNIEVEEIVSEQKDQIQEDFRESLFVVSDFAQKFFIETLHESEEGRNIGFTYFKERGFREETINKFMLGYSPSAWDALSKKATAEGYKSAFLEATGLSIKRDNGELYDRFRGRVMFPIHNLTGRVIAFGGRILKKDEKSPKYVNSPESEIYHKSKMLYGIYFAKKAIREQNNCFLVEGYTDVISLHQSGIENTVASSGTSLTVEQIRLISRFTQDVTILYDGDPAGIKASLRGIDLILEEGLNVKIVLFPEGEDPDSYVQKVGSSAFREFIAANQKDFILFKTSLLLEEVKDEPVKKAGLIYDIVESISKIPDAIKASLFIKECSVLLNIEERILLSELNKLRRKKIKQKTEQELPEQDTTTVTETAALGQQPSTTLNDEAQERDIIRLLISYGTHSWNDELTISQYIIHELENAEINNPLYNEVIRLYHEAFNNNYIPDEQHFIRNDKKEISELAASLLSAPYHLSPNWYKKHDILVPTEEQLLKQSVENALNHLKMKKVLKMIAENQQLMHEAKTEEEIMQRQSIHLQLTALKKKLSEELGAVILK